MVTLTSILSLIIGLIFLVTFNDVLAEPTLIDKNLVLEEFVMEPGRGYTTMTFVGEDILVLEKNGLVKLIHDGIIQNDPVLKVNVDSNGESGLLGITNVENQVYLFFTEKSPNGDVLGNRIYRYIWNGENLIDPVLLKDLPSHTFHNGGVMAKGLDNQIYALIGDTGINGPLQNVLLESPNFENMDIYQDTSVILQIEPEGPYHAIGIRNSFGMAIDPQNGNLWITENGPDKFDEINLVPYKFNSGWKKTMGPATKSDLGSMPKFEDYSYGDPKFSWEDVVAPTVINFAKFKETKKYNNSVFVGDCIHGNLYKFELNQERNGFEFTNHELKDNVVNQNDSMDEIVIGKGFRCITDIERGPDGFLYLISHGERNIYRILPKEAATLEAISTFQESSNGGGCLIATATFDSELSYPVQHLREIRDEKLLKTQSGEKFMSIFNQFYYSFSPQIADYERKNPIFKEFVKISLLPMILSLSILNHINFESEGEVLVYGISLIILNLGAYFFVPTILIFQIKKKIQQYQQFSNTKSKIKNHDPWKN